MASSISNVLAILSKGGVAYSNNFDVKFRFGGASLVPGDLTSVGINVTDQIGEDKSQGKWISLMCEEAVLPGVQASTGQISGRHMGEAQVNYPTFRMYSDLSLTWICDANMTPLKFLHIWMDRMFNDYGPSGNKFDRIGNNRYYSYGLWNRVNAGTVGGGNNRYHYVRLSYPEEYVCDELVITKCEKGPYGEQQRSSIGIHCLDAFPYSIDAVPLSYGSSQIVRVTANFYYTKWFSNFNTLFGDPPKAATK